MTQGTMHPNIRKLNHKDFLLGLATHLRTDYISPIDIQPAIAKHLWRNSFLSKIAILSPANANWKSQIKAKIFRDFRTGVDGEIQRFTRNVLQLWTTVPTDCTIFWLPFILIIA